MTNTIILSAEDLARLLFFKKMKLGEKKFSFDDSTTKVLTLYHEIADKPRYRKASSD